MRLQERIAALLRAQIAEATAQLEHAEGWLRETAQRNLDEYTRLLARQEATA